MSARHRHRNDPQSRVFDALAGDDDDDARTASPADGARPRRSRTRRGGARTPWPLLPLIGIVAGVAIAYVSQTAHFTQSTYQVSSLTAQQDQLKADNQRLSDQLDRLRSAARIDAAAQQLGMRPAAQWSYVAAQPQPIIVPPNPRLASASQDGDALQRLVAVLSGSFGTRNAEAAGR